MDHSGALGPGIRLHQVTHSSSRTQVTVTDSTPVYLYFSPRNQICYMTDEQYAKYKHDNPGGRLLQDSGVEMKCGSKYVRSNTGKTMLGVEYDGWWTNDLTIDQLKQVIDILKSLTRTKLVCGCSTTLPTTTSSQKTHSSRTG